MNKLYYFLFILFFSSEIAEAQNLSIRGQLKDAETNISMELVNVVLQTSDSIFVAGITSDKKGDFCFNKVQKNNYSLTISAIGYQKSNINLQGLSQSVDLGIILLQPVSFALEGVTIEASNILNQSDRKIIFPNEKQLKSATNGIDLLQTLMLPRLQISPLTDQVSLIGNAELQFRINGAPASNKDIVALLPKDISRIEYIENPGLRYGNAAAVLNYITKRYETGGSINISLANSPHVLYGNDRISGRFSYNKSEFGANYSLDTRDFFNYWRDNEEQFSFEDGNTLKRYEIGRPGRYTRQTHNLALNYNYQPSEKRFFNATFNYNGNIVPHENFRSQLVNNGLSDQEVDMLDLTGQKVKRNSLDLYYMQTLHHKQTIVFNLVGTAINTNLNRIYQEKKGNEILSDISTGIDGKKYSLIGEGIYEKEFDKGRLSAGLKHTESFSDNLYTQTDFYQSKMNQSETYAYTQFFGKIKKLDYSVGLGVSRSFLKQEGDQEYETYTFRPTFSLRYAVTNNFFLRLNGQIKNMPPSLSELSAVEQYIDSLQILRGNPELSPFKLYQTAFYTEYNLNKFTISADVSYLNMPNPIMESTYQQGNLFIQTYENQTRAQKLWSSITLKVGMLWDILQLSVTGGANYHLMEGNSYSHRYTNWYYQAMVYATYKNWIFMFSQYSAWNNFWGETLTGGENGQEVLLTYKYKNISIGGGVNNPFNKYRVIDENWNQYINKLKTRYIDESSCRVLLKFSWNFNIGRQLKIANKKVYNRDSDAGILNVKK